MVRLNVPILVGAGRGDVAQVEVLVTRLEVELGAAGGYAGPILVFGDEAEVGFARGIVAEDRAGTCGRVDPSTKLPSLNPLEGSCKNPTLVIIL